MVTKILQKLVLSTFLVLGAFTLAPAISSAATAAPPRIIAAAATDEDSSGNCTQGSCIYRRYITPAIQLLSAVAGILAVISFIIAGIQYSSSGADPQKVAAARQRIGNTIFGLIAYIFLFAFLNWVVPGGLL